MASEAPSFWWKKADWPSWVLLPVSFLYGKIAGRRMRRARRASVALPVICIGNFTVGGAGKTPTAITLARAAKAKGLKPGFLSRGYGGRLKAATLVDPQTHTASDVGDEPLLLAREALTVISRRRQEGARRLIQAGADLIIMDDGFQSASLVLDYALVVIDTVRGIGNGHLVPGGPVRAPLGEQMRQLSAILKVGNGPAADALVRQTARAGKPVFVATLEPRDAGDLAGASVLAFAGIADPAKFHRTLESVGAIIVEKRSFGDHAQLSEAEIAGLIDDATSHHLQLVTTSKDFVRLAGGKGRAAELAKLCRVVEVDMRFDDHNGPANIIDQAITNYANRRLRENRVEWR